MNQPGADEEAPLSEALSVRHGGRRPAGRPSAIGFLAGVGLVALIAGVWLASTSLPTWTAAVGTALRERRGQEVYNANCLGCHGGPTGGAIDDYPPRHNANGHTWHHPDCAIARVIRDGSDEVPEYAPPRAAKMVPFKDKLSSSDIEAVIVFIKTMWTPAERQAQTTFTKEMCFEAPA